MYKLMNIDQVEMTETWRAQLKAAGIKWVVAAGKPLRAFAFTVEKWEALHMMDAANAYGNE